MPVAKPGRTTTTAAAGAQDRSEHAAQQLTPDLRFSLLGPLRGWAGTAELDLGRPQQRELLAVLLTAAGRPVSTDLLIDGLWDQAARPAEPLRAVRTHVYRLRTELRKHGAQDVLATVGDGYALRIEPDALDTDQFERASAQAAADRAAGRPAAATRALLDAALELWAGEPLTGMTGPHAEAVRVRLTEVHAQLREAKLELDLEIGDRADVAAELGALVVEHPGRQRLRELQMLALHRAGRTGEALAVYEDTRRYLAGHAGDLTRGRPLPDRRLTDLQARILRADPELLPQLPAGAPPDHPAPEQLPRAAGDFTGRAELLEQLTGLLASPSRPCVTITALDGIGGVGKTALAVHAAERLREHFPDGRLYADLRGAGPESADPAAVLVRFLQALGADDNAIPLDLDERVALYRSHLADRRVLVLLDNAADAAQVTALLPGAVGCAVLVTSRARLTGLAGARHLTVGALTEAEAVELLGRVIGPERTAAEPEECATVVAACDRLPLAIRIAGARLAARPDWTVAELAGRLADEHRRLAELAVGDTAVAATFALSYAGLTPAQAGAFRLLSLPNVPEIGLDSAAALLGVGTTEADVLLEDLTDLNLLDPRAVGRYGSHDLIRLYASECCTREEAPETKRQALARLLDFCLASARQAEAAAHSVPVGQRDLTGTPTAAPGLEFDSAEQAVGWMRTEAQLQQAMVAAALTDHHLPLVQAADLIDKLGSVLFTRTHSWSVADLASRTAAVAATRGDRRCEALARYVRGNMLYHVNDFQQAEQELTRTIALCVDDATRRVRACALLALGYNARVYGRFEEARGYCEESIALFESLGDHHSAGGALGELAFNYAKLDRFSEARAAAERGVQLTGSATSITQATSRYSLARVLRLCGAPAAALSCAEELLPVLRALHLSAFEAATGNLIAQIHLEAGDDRQVIEVAEAMLPLAHQTSGMLEAGLLRSLGVSLARLGHPARGRACLDEAVEIYQTLGVPSEAADTLALLAKPPFG
ncbi:DNA-binding SARP family transcriptional activator [Kitasatospora sp. GP30]|uniref:AfsR/SARP family transcriptional regulator n=1 Tax=Kitasatospora sp. GP30 TaxID=3035084 RepID=UPI000C70386E|nr:AfsR/SARP family transcriptional regulator [Kitasatospora sp. GP30]MDH6144482.1 DNA-binding SARP family transcriptional activator [Kitasatospora sp. GP30]